MDRLDTLLEEQRGHQGLVDLPAIGPNVGESVDQHAATELELWIDNTYQLHKSKWDDFYKNLVVKICQGKYNRDAAVKLFMYLVERAAKHYVKENGGNWSQMFSKPTREQVAKGLRDEFEQTVKDEPEDLEKYKPKKYAKVALKV